MASILVVDDEKNIRSHLSTYVASLGHRVGSASNAAEALAALERETFEIVISDVRMPGLDGLALLREARQRQADLVVVLMTAYATVPQAVEAMRAGAYDYLVKPFSLDQVGLLLRRVLEVKALERENRVLRGAIGQPVLPESRSRAMQRVLETARQAAASDATILLSGESGTGKNVLASSIHQWSARRDCSFVTINCTTLVDHLLESELFGHLRGAFTGAWKDKVGRLEAAEGGTVFFDEVGELAPDLQAKLLRLIEEHRFERVGGTATIDVDARVIAATNRDLEADVAAGRFRQDLFFRLNVIAIRLPALRERPEDLAALTDHLLDSLRLRYRRGPLQVAADARELIAAYAWPGNIRELMNVLERAIVLVRGDTIRAEDLPDRLLAPSPVDTSRVAQGSSLEEVERRHIAQVLADCATLEEAAASLGINPTTLWRKRKRYGIE
jgi:NtrC-family two-component system response regulator AlgB